MTPADLDAARRQLGLSGKGMARELDVDERTYRRWAKGESPIPRTVELAVEALLARARV